MKLERFKINNRIHKVIYILGIIIIIFMSIFIFYKSYAVYEVIDNKNIIEGTVQEMGDLSFVFYIDGNVSMNVPEQKTNYVFNTEKSSCTNGI